MSKEPIVGTTNALEIIRRRLIKGDKKREERIRRYKEDFEVAQQIYDLRVARRLSQKELADLVGTTASVICRLEDADYHGHSLNMLRRIAKVLNCRVEVSFRDEEGYLQEFFDHGKRIADSQWRESFASPVGKGNPMTKFHLGGLDSADKEAGYALDLAA